MSDILEVVSTIFITVMLFAGALLIAVVAIAALGLLWKELRTAFKPRRTEELPKEEQGSDQTDGLK